MTAEPVIDHRALDAITSLQQPGMGNLLEKIIRLFLDESAKLVEAIAEAVSQHNADGLRAAAHSLKSSSANVGAMRVSSISRELEEAGRAGNLEQSTQLYQSLAGALSQASSQLESLLEN